MIELKVASFRCSRKSDSHAGLQHQARGTGGGHRFGYPSVLSALGACVFVTMALPIRPFANVGGYAALDPRIKVHYATEQGGISRASNTAWRMATGDYIGLLDHDDTLAPNALAYVCEAINQNPVATCSTATKIRSTNGATRFDPFFKPDWSPDLVLSENYICHMLVLRRDLAEKVGRFQSGFRWKSGL